MQIHIREPYELPVKIIRPFKVTKTRLYRILSPCRLKVYGYTANFLPSSLKRRKYFYFLIASLEEVAFPKWVCFPLTR